MALLAPVITAANVYGDNNVLIGTGDVTLPSLSYVTFDAQGAGVLGSVAVSTPNLEALELTINYTSCDLTQVGQASPLPRDLEIRANVQKTDQRTGELVDEGVAIFGRGRPKSVPLGSVIAGQQMGGSITYEMSTLRIDIDGAAILQIDKFNRIFKILLNGAFVDILERERGNT